MKLKIVEKKNIYLAISTVAVLASLFAIAMYGFKPGIDFTGGTLWQFTIGDSLTTVGELETVLKEELKLEDPKITREERTGSFIVKTKEISEEDHRRLLGMLQAEYPETQELSFQAIGPSVSGQLKKNALLAIAFAILGISLYIAFAFRKVGKPISSWKYGLMTLMTLFHDVAIPAGLLAILGHYGKVEIDSNFIVALLVVMGFSVHDTIVVFDRIRENLFLDRGKSSFAHIINESVNQTLGRSINTSLTLILVLLAMYFAGPTVLQYFILTLLVGVTTGIYSSVFVASPALLLIAPQKKTD
jgi:preprotein translocase subunit SecF